MKSGALEIAISYAPHEDLSRLRGSASPIEFEGGYLMVVHEVAFDQNAYYMHRFLLTDNEFNIKSLSKPFFFKQKGVEYCCAMTIDHTDKNLILSIGIEDREAYLVIIGLDTVKSLLETL